MQKILNRIYENLSVSNYWDYSIEDRKKILQLFPGMSAAHFDLAAAYYASKDFTKAKTHICKSIRRGYPVTAIAYNNLAAITASQGKAKASRFLLEKAKLQGRQPIVEKNIQKLNERINSNSTQKRDCIRLSSTFNFKLGAKLSQPLAPGPIKLIE